MFKKAIAVGISVITVLTASIPFSAASAAELKVLGRVSQKNGNLVIYNYNVPSDTTAYVEVKDNNTDESKQYYFADCYNHPISCKLEQKTYSTYIGARINGSGGLSSACSVNLADSAGKYERIRIKLHDYSDYFTEKGTAFQSFSFCGKHEFRFCQEQPDKYGNIFSSVLCIYSGGAVNHVVPDSKGEVEIYVSTQIGEPVRFSTEFIYERHQDGYGTGGGGGTSGSYFDGLTIGDADQNGYLSVSDVTEIQKNAAGIISFDASEKRSGDVNRDSVVDVSDATELQMYLAK